MIGCWVLHVDCWLVVIGCLWFLWSRLSIADARVDCMRVVVGGWQAALDSDVAGIHEMA